jgi:RHS repeat-associated protein
MSRASVTKAFFARRQFGSTVSLNANPCRRRTSPNCKRRYVAFLASIVPSICFAQTAAPTQLTLDENGVDLVQGNFTLVQTDVAIGPDGPGKLAYVRAFGYTGWTTNLDVRFFRSQENGQMYFYVQHGIIADRFLQSGTSYSSTLQNGSTLTDAGGGGYIFNAANGSTITFSMTEPEPGNKLNRIGFVKYPNGIQNVYNYNVASVAVTPCTTRPCTYRTYQRLSSVTNSVGYQLKLGYQATSAVYSSIVAWQTLASVTAINNAVDYCDPVASTCTGLTVTWPQSSYTQVVSGSNMVRTITDPNGGATRLTLSNTSIQSDPIAIKRPGSTTDTTTISRSAATGMVSSIIKEGQTWTYNFVDNAGTRTATITDPASNSQQAFSDIASGRLLSFRDALNRTTSYNYDVAGRATRVTLPEGNYTDIGYDGRGNIISTTRVAKVAGSPPNIVTTAGYDSACANIATCNQPNWTQDANGNQTNYTYDPSHGGALTITSPAPATGAVRPQTRYTYGAMQAYFKNSAGSMVASGQSIFVPTGTSSCTTTASCAGTADEVTTTLGYGAQVAGTPNNLISVTATSGSGDGLLAATTAFTYDAIGNKTYVDGPLPGSADTTRTLYDSVRQVVGVISPDPDGAGPLLNRATRLTYNLDGQVTLAEQGTTAGQSDANWSAFSPLQSVASTYDANARKITDQIQSGGTVYALTQYSYEALGRPACTATRMNSAVFASLPASACTLGTAGSYGNDQIAQTVYDAAGHVTKTQLAVGTADAADEATQTYTNNGKVATLADGNNNLTTYEYDGFDRITKIRFPAPTAPGTSSTTDYEQPTYDPNGNVVLRRLRDGQSIPYSYDGLNRLTLTSLPATGIDLPITYTYDSLGRLTNAVDQNGHNATYGYDALGRVVREANVYGGTKLSQYDLAGQRTRLTWTDGFYSTYDHLVTGETTAIRESGATSGVGVLGTYAYDNLGRRTNITKGNGTGTSYAYDPVGRLQTLANSHPVTTSDVNWSFTYSPASQIASSTRSNDAYAWTGHYNVDRPYAANGLNQLTTAGSTALSYDGRGNLTTSGSTTYSYSLRNLQYAIPGGYLYYDPLARLDYISSNSVTGAAQYMDYDGNRLIDERNDSVGITRRYIYGPSTDEVLVWYEGPGTTDRRWLAQDERGSVVEVTNASGATLAINTYDEYGIPGSGNLGRFQYTGQTWLTELGMYNYKARLYSPTLGRFMQTDPIGYGDGVNWYNYVGADPVNRKDSSGLFLGINFTAREVTPNVGGGGANDGEIVVTGSRTSDSFRDFGNVRSAPTVFQTAPIARSNGSGNRVARPKSVATTASKACDNVAKEPGPIFVDFVEGSAFAGYGVTGSLGVFYNLKTGSGGFFHTVGGGLGYDLDVGLKGGFYSRAADLRGFNANVNGSYGASGSANFSKNGRLVGGSAGLTAGVGGSATVTNTTLFGCYFNGGG